MSSKGGLYVKLFFIVIIFFGRGISGQSINHTSSLNDKDQLLLCKQKQQAAYADLKKGEAKYYNFGLLPPVEELSKKLKANKIKVVNKNCILIPELICYNNVILEKIKYKIN